jgi:hypothetical protein
MFKESSTLLYIEPKNLEKKFDGRLRIKSISIHWRMSRWGYFKKRRSGN